MTRHAIALAAILALAACAQESPQPVGGTSSTMDIIQEQSEAPAQPAAPEVEMPAMEAEEPASAPTMEDAASMMPEPDLETTIDAATPPVTDADIQAAQEQMEQTREALGEQMEAGIREVEEALPTDEPTTQPEG